MSDPRVIVEGATNQPHVRWRVVLTRKQDNNGIEQDVRYIELAEASDKDAMGCQRWRQLTVKSAQSDWMLVCEAALGLALERV